MEERQPGWGARELFAKRDWNAKFPQPAYYQHSSRAAGIKMRKRCCRVDTSSQGEMDQAWILFFFFKKFGNLRCLWNCSTYLISAAHQKACFSSIASSSLIQDNTFPYKSWEGWVSQSHPKHMHRLRFISKSPYMSWTMVTDHKCGKCEVKHIFSLLKLKPICFSTHLGWTY